MEYGNIGINKGGMFMFNFFKKKDKKEDKITEEKLHAIVDGEAISIESVPDAVFSQKMMGDGFAVKPTDSSIYSPVEGIISNVFPTKHAIGITTKGGLEILVHIGIDTVELDGKPFETTVSEGDTVTPSTVISVTNFNQLKESGKDSTVIVIVTNMDKVEHVDISKLGSVKHGDEIGTVTLK